jgi:hypothetical protein
MTIASVGTLGANSSTAADQSSIAMNASATAEAGHVVIVVVATDNAGTVDGDEGAVSSIVDSSGNTWSKAIEYAYTKGAARGAAVVSVWYCIVATQIDSGDTITANLTNSADRDAACISAWEFTISGSSLSVAGSAVLGTNGGNPGPSMTLSGLASAEYLWLRADAVETQTGPLTSWTSGWTSLTQAQANSGVLATSISLGGEFTIATATSRTSDPNGAFGGRDQAAVLIAFSESASGPILTQLKRGMCRGMGRGFRR